MNKKSLICYIGIGCALLVVPELLLLPRAAQNRPAVVKPGGAVPSSEMIPPDNVPSGLLFEKTWQAIRQKESGGNPKKINRRELAWGIAQIKPIMIADVNRILGYNAFRHEDAFDPSKARQMFEIYQYHYWPHGGPEQWARAWCSGPKGPDKPCSLEYWRDIEKHMKEKANG